MELLKSGKHALLRRANFPPKRRFLEVVLCAEMQTAVFEYFSITAVYLVRFLTNVRRNYSLEAQPLISWVLVDLQDSEQLSPKNLNKFPEDNETKTHHINNKLKDNKEKKTSQTGGAG